MDPFDNRFEKDLVAARKVQKAGREKLRREKLNEQFLELGNALDPEQHKNDKVTILRDTIQMLKDLTAKINTLKAEYNSLSEESHELTQEKNELREEKANLKSAVDHLNVQCQQRLAVVHPWAICDSSLILHPPYPVPIPSAPILIHSVRPYPFFHNPSQGTIHDRCSTGMVYPSCNSQAKRSSIESQNSCKEAAKWQTSSHQYPGNKPCDDDHQDSGKRNSALSDVATELELKSLGSSVSIRSQSAHNLDVVPSGTRKRPQLKDIPSSSSSSRCSSCSVAVDNSSVVGDGPVSENK
ncbi:transcription factor bHLH121-like isoform X1 [Zingiber officinale]|uniref:transcription factor bHLH121-like isoform X1 n=1 Tax=Zingiber officinale TaxID=94328 RepID=UPI001C4C5D19|nr:transcription factor bHLH121-like isoform X1 [Zingiber officinale]